MEKIYDIALNESLMNFYDTYIKLLFINSLDLLELFY